MSYARLSKRSLLFRSFTGLEISEFDVIAKDIESKYDEHERKRLSNRKRERKVGAGRPFKLKVKERFLILLVYYRLYITYTLSGFLFDLDQSNICRDISMLEPLVKLCIPLPKKLYKSTRRLRTIDEVEEDFPGFKAFIDSSEQEIPRPKNKRRRKSYYSGKKKKHTVKTQYMVNSEVPYCTKQVMIGEEYMIMRFSKINILQQLHRKLRMYLILGTWEFRMTFPL